MACSLPIHYLNQCRLIFHWTIKNKFQWNWNQNTIIFIVIRNVIFHRADYIIFRHDLPSFRILLSVVRAILSSSSACQGWGLLSQFPSFRYFLNFLALSEYTLAIEYHVYIWQVSSQLSCGGTCEICTWFKEYKRYFCQIENFACGEINEL